MRFVHLAPADYDRLVELWQRAGVPFRARGRDSREALTRQLGSGLQAVIALEHKGDLLGAVVVTHDGRKGWINRLAVDPAHQRQGLGSQLIRESERYLGKQGLQVIGVLAKKENMASISTFTEAGYLPQPDVLYLSKRSSPDS
jgi:ribosomal protein S18 acetylase RimI-like enzyme